MTHRQAAADGPDHEAGLLLERARPEVYRVNAFRVSGLQVDATGREIQRRVERVRMQERLGAAPEPSPGGLGLDPPPDADAVREARQWLTDPERRLIEELFWFWPRRLGEGVEDPALGSLTRGDMKQATALWVGQENSRTDGAVAVHNLAVLAHATVLDLEHKGRGGDLTPEERSDRETLWPQAFKRWRALVSREDFWNRLSDRILDLDDPRLTVATVEGIRRFLPLALLLISARLAARSVEAGEIAEAERHVRRIRDSGFEERWVEEALHRASKVPRRRIQVICESAEDEAKAKPESADRMARQVMEQTESHLATLDLLLPEDDAYRQGAHDEVALRVLACQIAYGNETDDWKTSLAILEQTREIVAGEAARARIEENLRIVRGNLEQQLEHGVCFFCSELPPDDGVAHVVKLHGDVMRIPVPGGVQIRWRGLTVKVPRCVGCKEAQNKMTLLTGAGAVLGALVTIGSCLATGVPEGDGGCVAFLFAFALLAALGTGLGWIVGKAVTKKGVRPESDAVKFPPIQRLLAEGWSVGEKPSDAQ